MTAVIGEYDRDTVAYLKACGVEGSLLGRVERLTEEVADLQEARERAEANHPARLLGVAQSAIETALRTNDLTAIHAQLAAALDRIKPEPADRYCSSPRSNHGDGRGCEDEACPKHGHPEEENAA